jgi:hypothetical protein
MLSDNQQNNQDVTKRMTVVEAFTDTGQSWEESGSKYQKGFE